MNPAELPLRDIHLPPPVGWWPPAAGWWLLAALVLLAIAGVLVFRHQMARRRRRLSRWLAPAIADVRGQFAAGGDPLQAVQRVSELLRRACLSLYPRERVAGLLDEQWLSLLDRVAGRPLFSEGDGRLLASAPYSPRLEREQAARILATAEAWTARCSHRLIGDPPP